MNPNASLKSLNAKSRVIASLSACIRQPGSSDSASIRSASVSCGMGMRGSFACRSSGFRLSGDAREACRLSARDLACRRGDRVLFSGLSFALEPGQAVQVTGANGIGKSSLIRILAGLLRPYAGAVERDGADGLLDDRLALGEHSPLAVPSLVVGAGALATGGASGLALTAAISLVLAALAPFAGGAAVRAAREG